MPVNSFMILFLILSIFSSCLASGPDPEAIVLQSQSVEDASSTSGRRLLDHSPCHTGNPLCDPNWANGAMGGKEGQSYVVADPRDGDLENHALGTLRHAMIQVEPPMIQFAKDMHINLKSELMVWSSKTIDGRGANVHLTEKDSIVIENTENVIIHEGSSFSEMSASRIRRLTMHAVDLSLSNFGDDPSPPPAEGLHESLPRTIPRHGKGLSGSKILIAIYSTVGALTILLSVGLSVYCFCGGCNNWYCCNNIVNGSQAAIDADLEADQARRPPRAQVLMVPPTFEDMQNQVQRMGDEMANNQDVQIE